MQNTMHEMFKNRNMLIKFLLNEQEMHEEFAIFGMKTILISTNLKLNNILCIQVEKLITETHFTIKNDFQINASRYLQYAKPNSQRLLSSSQIVYRKNTIVKHCKGIHR